MTEDVSNRANVQGSELISELRTLIHAARTRFATAANAELTILYWRIGRRLLDENLSDGRADYGQRILVTVSQQLEREFGKGFSYSGLTRMVRFAELFPEERIVVSLTQVLSWTHILALLPLKDHLAREFYAEMCRVERWSVRTLRQKIAGMLFERTALSKNSEELIRQELASLRDDGRMSPELVFRDPYLLDFLGLSGAYSERDLETAILREMERFLLELGSGFSFVARQKRMSIGKDDFYLDLLFYHRLLRRLVAIELKLEVFRLRITPARWSNICAGWTNTNGRRAKNRPLVSSSAPGPMPSRWNCCNSMRSRSGSPNT
jgi:predicted nuclease of restriction endonuclease-like (RecB) superfamily